MHGGSTTVSDYRRDGFVSLRVTLNSSTRGNVGYQPGYL